MNILIKIMETSEHVFIWCRRVLRCEQPSNLAVVLSKIFTVLRRKKGWLIQFSNDQKLFVKLDVVAMAGHVADVGIF